MDRFKKFLHDKFNPLHIYCRMRDRGVEKECAMWRCKWYERMFYRKISKFKWFKIKEF
jgi:hypothetical protein